MTVVVTPGSGAEGAAAPAPSGDGADPWVRAWRWTSLAAAVLVVLLAITGVVLHFEYRPTADQSWPAIVELAGGGEPAGEQVARRVHRAASQLLVPIALASAIAGVGAVVTRRTRATVVRFTAALAVPILALVASISGYLLPWDQLAFWAVDVDTDLRGMSAAFSDQIRFVLIDGTEISQTTLQRWYVVHIAIAVGLAVTLIPGLLAWRRRR